MLARIDDGAVVEMREISIDEIPAHKRALWLPVEYEGDGPQVDVTVEANRVRVVRSMPLPTRDDYARAIQIHVDAVAQGKGYRDGYAAATYASSGIPQWKTEATTFIAWRDSVWVASFTIMAEVEQKVRAQPSIETLIASLPQIVWPDDV
jgi:hypothetical protein